MTDYSWVGGSAKENVGGWVGMIDGQDSSMPLVPLGLHLAALGTASDPFAFGFSAPSLPIPKWPLGDTVANANIMWP